ncbi:DUF1217 domain-containing protein [Roseobacter ponti]|uniref:DUF1217 domain-containing protein n=1 Tax=Roseobacter ponti TaxID=1891787 RepID=A0A858SYB7_9RHOB|nr:DUF1217 domain-containing protein [Roseobacter ponti]QJF52988.1 DUF1217 domain-containing protein [Roseobacter ponti]
MFQPIIPGSGLAGWSFLQRTYDTQIRTFSEAPQQSRVADYFAENITGVKTAKDLVSDRRLLEVALGAFGLQDDIENRFFIQKMLEEGSVNDDALANRFSDRRYSEFVESFGFGPGETTPVGTQAFTDKLISRYFANSFEVAAGQQDDSMRVALYAQRTLAELASPAAKPPERVAAELVSASVDEYVASITDETEYFESRISSVLTVEDLLSDERLLKFSLVAFGLGDDYEEIVNFEPTAQVPENETLKKIANVLSQGSIANIALANQLDNPAYAELSRAFGFGIAEDRQTTRSSFPDIVIDRYIQQNFSVPEDAGFTGSLVISDREFELEPFSLNDMSNDAKWFTILGEPPLRALFEKAFNLPSEFGQVDIEQQLYVFKERARAAFGDDNVNRFSDPVVIEDLIQKYLTRSQIDAFSVNTSPASIALTLLQS